MPITITFFMPYLTSKDVTNVGPVFQRRTALLPYAGDSTNKDYY